MTVQRMHPSLKPIDILTRPELDDSLGHNFDHMLREQFRGMKLIRIPVIRATATGTSTLIAQSANDGAPVGPEQGFMWQILRVTVASNGADSGAAALYAGSDPTNQDGSHLIDNTLAVGRAYYPGNKGVYLFGGEFLYVVATTVNGNQYSMTGLASEVPAEMIGKLL